MAGIISEAIPDILRDIGASIKWCFYLNKKRFKDIIKESWNGSGRIGLFFILVIVVLMNI
ncbi:hypothetical protein [Winogradskyella sp.]|uniref:hypothetical protein n=1 Tax=Winogradskyella sp. TaxID=1883156 RepID=UPI0026391039|nr:hypothetical protein [Winogradskyella sp.]